MVCMLFSFVMHALSLLDTLLLETRRDETRLQYYYYYTIFHIFVCSFFVYTLPSHYFSDMYHLTCRWRIAIVFLLVPSLCVLLWLHTQSVAASRHLRQRPAQSQNAQIQSSGAKSNRGDKVEDFTAVVASLQKDDTEWLNELNWDVWKYEVDDPDAEHKTPINKGSEGMVYLT
jgi:hypothetical protein